jgi:hypothetical protein
MSTESLHPQFESVDDSQLAATTGGGKASDLIAKIGAKIDQVDKEVVPAVKNALPGIGGVVAAAEDVFRK